MSPLKTSASEREIDRLTGGVHRGDERRCLAIDAPAHDTGAAYFFDRQHRRCQIIGLIGGPADAQHAIAVDFVLEPPDGTVGPLLEKVRLVRSHLPHVEHRRGAPHDRFDFVGRNLLRMKNGRERRAGGDARGHGREIRRERDVLGSNAPIREAIGHAAPHLARGGRSNGRRDKK
jgi:hypothetical protein